MITRAELNGMPSPGSFDFGSDDVGTTTSGWIGLDQAIAVAALVLTLLAATLMIGRRNARARMQPTATSPGEARSPTDNPS